MIFSVCFIFFLLRLRLLPRLHFSVSNTISFSYLFPKKKRKTRR